MPPVPRSVVPASRGSRRRAVALSGLVLAGVTSLAGIGVASSAAPAGGQHRESVHAREWAAHARDQISFSPGGRVRVGFRPRAGDTRPVGGRAPVALPAGRLSGAELRGLTATDGDAQGAVPAYHDEAGAGSPDGATALRREVFAYLPYWEMGSDTRLDYRVFSTIAYFGVGASRSGELMRRTPSGALTTGWAGWTSSRMTQIIDDAHARGTRVVLTVERFSWGPRQIDATVGLLSNAAARRRLASEIAAAVRNRGADGVNLDFEPIPNGQRDNFTAFVRQVRAALDAQAPGYQLTFASLRREWLDGYDIASLTAPGAADAAFIMGYEYRSDGALDAGSNAPLDRRDVPPSPSPTPLSPPSLDPGASLPLPTVTPSPDPHATPDPYETPPPEPDDDLRRTVDAYLAHTSPDKVILGLPWYGRSWSTETANVNSLTRRDDETWGDSIVEIYAVAANLGLEYGRRYDSFEHSAWTWRTYRACSECAWTTRQTYWDDVESLRAKFRYAESRGLRGVGIWALGYDGARPEMQRLLDVTFRRPSWDTTAPSGSVAFADGTRYRSSLRVPLSVPATDGSGSGVIYVRISNSPPVDGRLTSGRTFTYERYVTWYLPSSASDGRHRIYVQWADVANNWSAVSSIEAVLDR